jgi:hypothetical protein
MLALPSRLNGHSAASDPSGQRECSREEGSTFDVHPCLPREKSDALEVAAPTTYSIKKTLHFGFEI